MKHQLPATNKKNIGPLLRTGTLRYHPFGRNYRCVFFRSWAHVTHDSLIGWIPVVPYICNQGSSGIRSQTRINLSKISRIDKFKTTSAEDSSWISSNNRFDMFWWQRIPQIKSLKHPSRYDHAHDQKKNARVPMTHSRRVSQRQEAASTNKAWKAGPRTNLSSLPDEFQWPTHGISQTTMKEMMCHIGIERVYSPNNKLPARLWREATSMNLAYDSGFGYLSDSYLEDDGMVRWWFYWLLTDLKKQPAFIHVHQFSMESPSSNDWLMGNDVTQGDSHCLDLDEEGRVRKWIDSRKSRRTLNEFHGVPRVSRFTCHTCPVNHHPTCSQNNAINYP